MTLWPREHVRKIHPGVGTPADTDAAWRVVGDPGEPVFDPAPGGGDPWLNAAGPWDNLQFRLRDDGVVEIEAVLENVSQPLGQYGSRVFTLPVGYRPAGKIVVPGSPWTVWGFDAPTSVQADLPGSVMWEGISVPLNPVFANPLRLSFLAEG